MYSCLLPHSSQTASSADDYKTLVSKMFKGEIKVDNNTEKMPEVKAVKVDDQGKIK